MSSSAYIMSPVITMSSASSNVIKHANSIRKKGRFRVRRVSKTPDGLKDSLKREVSSSPVKSGIVATNAMFEDVIPLHYASLSTTRVGQHGRKDVIIYSVSKLFGKYYDTDLASKYILDELGNS